MLKTVYILGDISGKALSVCPGTIKTFDTYEEAKTHIRYAGMVWFVGKIKTLKGKLASKEIWWEDGKKVWCKIKCINDLR